MVERRSYDDSSSGGIATQVSVSQVGPGDRVSTSPPPVERLSCLLMSSPKVKFQKGEKGSASALWNFMSNISELKGLSLSGLPLVVMHQLKSGGVSDGTTNCEGVYHSTIDNTFG